MLLNTHICFTPYTKEAMSNTCNKWLTFFTEHKTVLLYYSAYFVISQVVYSKFSNFYDFD